MAVNIVRLTTVSGLSPTDPTTPWDNTVDCTGGEILAVLVLCPVVSSAGAYTLTYNGNSLTKQVEATNNNVSSAVWTLASPTTGENTLRLSWSSGILNWLMYAFVLSGLDSATPILGTTSKELQKTDSQQASVFAPGVSYSITQSAKRSSLFMATGLIEGLTDAGGWQNSGGGTPVLSGGTDLMNSGNLTTFTGNTAVWAGYRSSSGTGETGGTVYSVATQSTGSYGGGVGATFQSSVAAPLGVFISD